jgi:hypothetical protein
MQLKHVPADLFSYADETKCNTRNINTENAAALNFPPNFCGKENLKIR